MHTPQSVRTPQSAHDPQIVGCSSSQKQRQQMTAPTQVFCLCQGVPLRTTALVYVLLQVRDHVAM